LKVSIKSQFEAANHDEEEDQVLEIVVSYSTVNEDSNWVAFGEKVESVFALDAFEERFTYDVVH
jgi:hypothetical protein